MLSCEDLDEMGWEEVLGSMCVFLSFFEELINEIWIDG